MLGSSHEELAKQLAFIVNAEGPILAESATQRVLVAWDTRRGNRIEAYLSKAIDLAVYNKLIQKREDFLWPVGMQTPPLRVHISGETLRSLDEIAPEEIMTAVKACIQHGLGLLQDDLIRESLKLFGLMATRDNSMKTEKIITQMVSKKILQMDEGRIRKGIFFSIKSQ